MTIFSDPSDILEWRWVDDKGRGLTNWKRGDPPPVMDLPDAKGSMHVETRLSAEAVRNEF